MIRWIASLQQKMFQHFLYTSQKLTHLLYIILDVVDVLTLKIWRYFCLLTNSLEVKQNAPKLICCILFSNSCDFPYDRLWAIKFKAKFLEVKLKMPHFIRRINHYRTAIWLRIFLNFDLKFSYHRRNTQSRTSIEMKSLTFT